MGDCCWAAPRSAIGTARSSLSRSSQVQHNSPLLPLECYRLRCALQLPVFGAAVRARDRAADKGCSASRAADTPRSKSSLPLMLQPVLSRRLAILCAGVPLVSTITNWNLAPLPVKAEESSSKTEEEEGHSGVLGALKSVLDPDERTKSGRMLPKAYLKSAREVVKTLRASLEEDANDIGKFRRTADAAKESIREYLNDWRGQPAVAAEESYAALVRAIRSLASFYSKSGPFATLPEEVKTSILNDLNTAESFL